MDKVFLLSDVDEFYDQLEKIFKGNQTDVQGRWVVSNPCFEIWLYYCYLDSPEKVLGCLKTEPITTRSKKMKALGNTLVSGGLNPCLAFENMLNGIEHLIAKITGTTYNEVNIIVYYLVIPLSWTIMLDYITRMPFLTPLFLLAWIVFIWKDKMDFRTRCDLAFKKSVDFLLWFQKIGWNYIVSSVIICVVIPILVYIELIYAIINLNL